MYTTERPKIRYKVALLGGLELSKGGLYQWRMRQEFHITGTHVICRLARLNMLIRVAPAPRKKQHRVFPLIISSTPPLVNNLFVISNILIMKELELCFLQLNVCYCWLNFTKHKFRVIYEEGIWMKNISQSSCCFLLYGQSGI